jgi:hypothetical protein
VIAGLVARSALCLGLAGVATGASAVTGRELIDNSLRQHAPASHVYQEQTLITSDNLGQHTVRTARYYGRRSASGQKVLLVIDTPAELRGVSVMVERDAKGGNRRGPAASSALFGSNFSVADLEQEQPQDFLYEVEDSQDLDRVSHHVIRATPASEAVAQSTGYGVRRIFLRKDNLFVSRIDYLDRQGQPAKRQTFRDSRPDETGAWRAGMILTEDLRDSRRSLVKVERRVHSADYVPESVFAGLR